MQDTKIDDSYLKKSKDFFNRRFSQHIIYSKKAYQKRYGFVLSCLDIKPQDVVVDIGCAQGGTLLICRQKGIKAYGLDFSLEALKIAKKLGLNNLICADVHKIALKSNSFDKLITLQILEILEDKKSTIEEIKRIAKIDAQFYFEVRNGSFVFRKLLNSINNTVARITKSQKSSSVVNNDPSYLEWVGLFTDLGYKIEKVFKSPVYFYYENPWQLSRTVIIKLVHLLLPKQFCFTL